MFLIVAATIYLMFSVCSDIKTAYMESLTIYVGVFFASLVSAFCDWIKERQYLKIKDEINNAEVIVYRGQYGTGTSISVRDLVVGDVIDVQQGDRIPADCVLVEETNISVDQSMYNPKHISEEKEMSHKASDPDSEEPDNHKEHPDPFLLSSSMVMTGSGRALVCAVGKNTRLARSRQPQDLQIKEQQTFLEEKLEVLASSITSYAMAATIGVVVFQFVYYLILVLLSGDHSLFSTDTLLRLAKIVIIAACILIVAIPEGLPLAVSIAMALSISKLKNHEILIKNLDSVLTSAMLHDICIGKTGTITRGKMHVAKMQFCDMSQVYDNPPVEEEPDFFQSSLELEIQPELKTIVKEAIICNTDVRMEPNDKDMTFEPFGQPLEVALIKFLMHNKEDVQQLFINRNHYHKKILELPFDQEKKRKIVARSVPEDETQVRVYIKGAPEEILPLCSDTFDFQMQQQEFDDDEQSKILLDVVSS